MAKRPYEAEERLLQALLVQIRQEAGMRQVDVARKLRRPQSFVSNYEAGKCQLDFPELDRICEIVGVSLLELAHTYEAALQDKRQPDDLGMRRRGKKPKGRRP